MPIPGVLRLPTTSQRSQLFNKQAWNGTRSLGTADFYTIGYSGRDTPAFITALVQAEIATVVDVRCNAVSMYKPDFTKRNLERLLAEYDIEYLHRSELGVPREIRARAMETGTRDVIWQWYDTLVIPKFTARRLDFFLNFADHPVALMCTEMDPTACHRHRLAIALERLRLRSYDL